jgi:hypothetical protein
MAIYYVRNDGNDANTGLGSTTALAWKTVQKALGATGIGSGDTVYIAPGVYRENVTIAGTYTAATYIIGDPTATQFAGISQGLVRLTNYLTTDTASPSGTIMSSGSKNFLNISFLYFDGSAIMLQLSNSNNCMVQNCAFIGSSLTGSSGIQGSFSTGVTANNTISKCIFMTGSYGVYLVVGGNHTSDWSIGITIQDCAFIGASPVTASTPAMFFTRNTGVATLAGGINIYNCYIQSAVQGISFDCGNVTYPTNVRNCIITNCGIGIAGRATTTNIQDYNRIIGCTVNLSSVATGANTVTVGPLMVDIGMSQLFGLSAKQTWFSALPASLNIGFGDPTGALTTDLFGSTWFNGAGDPDAGALTSIQLSNTSYYYPTERNASTITIAPASTSQSIELYLGATGLTFSTSGLAAYYVRNQAAPVAITLVTQTATGAWSSGGFAEISSSLVPGVYRLDVPNAAFAAGASDVTIVVRGASGTNGAVLTVTLSSGGLTAAQTAAAVWDEPYTSHTTASTFGARTLKTTVDNRNVDVGTSFHIQSNVHAIVDSTAAASELSGALLHNGTDYISAELLTPVSAATSVHIGPYQLLADGLGADQPLDINVGTATSIDVQVTDANGTGIDITGATVSAKVYSSAGTLVATYSGTATYADNGRLTFGLTTTVTNTSGTYTVLVTRTTGATDTQIFGPLRLYVRPV